MQQLHIIFKHLKENTIEKAYLTLYINSVRKCAKKCMNIFYMKACWNIYSKWNEWYEEKPEK